MTSIMYCVLLSRLASCRTFRRRSKMAWIPRGDTSVSFWPHSFKKAMVTWGKCYTFFLHRWRSCKTSWNVRLQQYLWVKSEHTLRLTTVNVTIKLGWKYLQATNIATYFLTASTTKKRSFITFDTSTESSEGRSSKSVKISNANTSWATWRGNGFVVD